MKLKVYEEVLEPVKKEEKLYLRLVEKSDSVLLVACDKETGNTVSRGNLLEIYSNGSVERLAHVSDDLGFNLDTDGRLRISIF